MPHSIRLREPWQRESPADGGVRWIRAFQRPTGLTPEDSILLVVEGLPAGSGVAVNGHAPPLAGSGGECFDLTALLADRNRIEILAVGDSPHFPFAVRLDIVASAPAG